MGGINEVTEEVYSYIHNFSFFKKYKTESKNDKLLTALTGMWMLSIYNICHNFSSIILKSKGEVPIFHHQIWSKITWEDAFIPVSMGFGTVGNVTGEI